MAEPPTFRLSLETPCMDCPLWILHEISLSNSLCVLGFLTSRHAGVAVQIRHLCSEKDPEPSELASPHRLIRSQIFSRLLTQKKHSSLGCVGPNRSVNHTLSLSPALALSLPPRSPPSARPPPLSVHSRGQTRNCFSNGDVEVGARKVDIRLPGEGDSNSHGARPVH